MKTMSPGLVAHLDGEVTTLACLWRLERTDGWVRGFTDHDQDITYLGLTYIASTGFLPSAIKSGSDLSVDNLDVDGFLDDDALRPEDLTAGRFDGARIDMMLVNWADLAQGHILLRRSWLGEVKRADQRFSAEVRGLANRLQQTSGNLYSRLCRTSLGSAECTVSLLALTDTLAISAVASGDTFTVPTSRTDGFFAFGTCTFLSGANAGAATEILSHVGQSVTLTEIGRYPFRVERSGDVAFGPAVFDEHPIHAPNEFDLVRGPEHQHDPVGLQALAIAAAELSLHIAMFVDQNPPQAVAGRTALAEAIFGEPALTGKHLDRQLAAVFAGHHALDGLQEIGADAAIVLELLAAIMNANAGAGADMLMVGAFVGILKPAPTADVVNQDGGEVGRPGSNLGDQSLDSLAAVDPQAASAGVFVNAQDP